jgi:hypothetical protein
MNRLFQRIIGRLWISAPLVPFVFATANLETQTQSAATQKQLKQYSNQISKLCKRKEFEEARSRQGVAHTLVTLP